MSDEALQIAEKRREAKGKGKQKGYTHLNADLQRITRREKKAFLSDQWKQQRKTIEWEFGKLSSGHRTGKGQFSFQFQRKAMPKMLKLLHNCTHLTR